MHLDKKNTTFYWGLGEVVLFLAVEPNMGLELVTLRP